MVLLIGELVEVEYRWGDLVVVMGSTRELSSQFGFE